MELSLKRPLLFFDIESTGLNIATDAIVELCFVKVFPGPEVEGVNPQVWTKRIRPWDLEHNRVIPMTPGASEVNHIKDEDLVGEPRFIELIPEITELLRGCDLAGFNSAKFDLPLLAEEFERVRAYCTRRMAELKAAMGNNGSEKQKEQYAKAEETLALIAGVDLHESRMVDVQNIYHKMEPHNLRAAYRFYCGGKDFENAHSADADTWATYEVLKAQLDRYAEPAEDRQEVLKNDVDALSAFSARTRNVDFAGRLILGENGEPTISFGKHKGRTAREVWETEPAYFAWIEGGDFTLDTKAQFARLKARFERERKEARAARQAALNRPATDDELASLRDKFSGKLF